MKLITRKTLTGNTTVSLYPQSSTMPDGMPSVYSEMTWLDSNNNDGTWMTITYHQNICVCYAHGIIATHYTYYL